MQGLMMDTPLMISSIIEHAALAYGRQEVVTRTVEGPVVRATYAEVRDRSKKLAKALIRLGVTPGDRVGTIAWNTQRHLEAYYAVSGMGAIIQTMNPSYSPEQLVYILNHAENEVVLVDLTFLPLVAALRPHAPKLRHVIVMTDAAHRPEGLPDDVLTYETLLDAEDADYVWPVFDENTASGLCYTSGTTGNPKGVLYSHRSTVLHAMMSIAPAGFASRETQCVLPVVPMFHAMAWGIAYGAPMGGSKLVLPGAGLDGESLWTLMEDEEVRLAAGVPTIWLGLMATMRAKGRAPRSFHRTVIGGAAPAPAMIRAYEEEFGISVVQGWGMTEMSPIGSTCDIPPSMEGAPIEEIVALKAKQGRQVYGVELEIFDEDDSPLPHDGKARGRLCARGPWIAKGYFRSEISPLTPKGWLDTGDIATIDADGFMHIVDRAKDLVKSGGEWISSIDLENCAMDCDCVAQAAAISVPHPKWDERPIIVAVPRQGVAPDRDRVLAHMAGKLPKWMVPDDVVFVEALPLGATGKVQKTKLRETYRDHLTKG